DEQVASREQKGLSERLQLVRVQSDSGPERRLEQLRIGRRDAIPPQRVDVCGEEFGLIEAAFRDRLPRLAGHDLGVNLVVPEDFERITLGVVIDAGEANDR